MPKTPPGFEAFSSLPWKERWFVRARIWTAPLQEMSDRVPEGRVLDVGCGHGALAAIMAANNPPRHVTGIDPDRRKIEWAMASVGRLPNVDLRHATIDDLSGKEVDPFDSITVADVLYLLPVDEWEAFLSAAFHLLRPGGRLFLKEAEGDNSWRHLKCLGQEMLMVNIIRRTRSSGAIKLQARSVIQTMLTNAGFAELQTTDFSRGYTTPHILFECRRPEG